MSTPLLDLSLRVPRSYGLMLLSLHGCTLVLLLYAPLPLFSRMLLLLSLVWLSRRAWSAWQKLKSIQRLLVLPEGFRLVVGETEVEATGGSQTFVSSYLIVLHVRSACGDFCLPLLPGSANQDDLRQLRVWLRCRYRTGTTDRSAIK